MFLAKKKKVHFLFFLKARLNDTAPPVLAEHPAEINCPSCRHIQGEQNKLPQKGFGSSTSDEHAREQMDVYAQEPLKFLSELKFFTIFL